MVLAQDLGAGIATGAMRTVFSGTAPCLGRNAGGGCGRGRSFSVEGYEGRSGEHESMYAMPYIKARHLALYRRTMDERPRA